jgi:hypothetical protein
MSVSIVERLKSVPVSIRVQQEATLRLVLRSHSEEGERATVEYRLNPGNEFVFAENDSKVIEGSFDVATEPTIAERRYALKGPAGRNVQVTAIVLPDRIDQSKETVTVLK